MAAMVVTKLLISKKGLFLGVTLLMSLFLFLGAGCGKKAVETNKVIVWHWMTDRQEAFEGLATKYKELTGIDVQFELSAPSQLYESKVRAAAQTKTLPDIFGVLGETRDFASFIGAGHITDLTAEMEANGNQWKNEFFPKALENIKFLPGNEYKIKPGLYGVPIDVTNIQLLYNKDIFNLVGLDADNPPQTWDEFVAASKKIQEGGYQVLIGGFGETWMLDCLASDFAWNLIGRAGIIDTIKGEMPYTHPEWIEVFGLFETMYKKKLIATGAVTMVNKVAEQNFANEKAAIAFNGSWCVNVYHSMNPQLNYGVMLPPEVSDKHPRAIWGGAGSSFMVNSNSPMKQAAIDFLKWITAVPQQVFLAEQTRNLPSNKNSLKEIPPVLSQFVDDMNLVVHPRQLPVTEFSTVIEAFDKGIQSILIGEKTPKQIAEHIQAVKERELKRAKR